MPDTLYYDGKCALCAGEIARLARLKAETLQLCDIHALPHAGAPAATACASSLPDRETLLRDLHLRTADGRWLTGAEANVAAWQHTRLGWLWRPLRWPLIRLVIDALYRPWASWRYRRLYGTSCSAASASPGTGPTSCG